MTRQTRRWVFFSVQTGSILVLAGGLAAVNPWLGATYGIFLISVVGLYQVRRTGWLPHLLLFACTMGAALGIWLSAPAFLMIISAAMALAGWELSEADLQNKITMNPFTLDYEKRRILTLLAVLIGSLLLVGILILVKVSIPFVFLFAAGVVILFSIFRLYRIFRR
jgi:hypothetical protein